MLERGKVRWRWWRQPLARSDVHIRLGGEISGPLHCIGPVESDEVGGLTLAPVAEGLCPQIPDRFHQSGPDYLKIELVDHFLP